MLLLQLNRNQILYRNIIAKTLKDKLVYELRKQREIYGGRVEFGDYQKLSKDDKRALKAGAVKAFRSIKDNDDEAKRKGEREDHTLLAPEVQDLIARNAEIYPRMRSVHERLKLMDTDCDRYPFVKELIELDEELRQNWETYDTAEPLDPNAPKTTEVPKNSGSLTAQQVGAARAYLSRYRASLRKLKNEGNEKGYSLS